MSPKRLMSVVLVFALAWGGYWLLGVWALQSSLDNWVDERRADGWHAEWADVEVRGFPNRLDATFTDLTLADASGTGNGWAWQAPVFQILRLRYEPNHMVLAFPGVQYLQTPYQKLTISGASMLGSLVLFPGQDRQLDRSTLIFDALDVASDAGWKMHLNQARLGIRPTAGRANAYDFGIEMTGLEPPNQMLRNLSDAEIVPGMIQSLHGDLSVTFDRPWDRLAIEDARPQPTLLDIRDLHATWGQLQLRVAGTLDIDANGVPAGDLLIKATNWRDLLQIARSGYGIPDGIADAVEAALELASQLAGSPKTLDIPVSFRSGRIYLGPVPVGAAPNLRLH